MKVGNAILLTKEFTSITDVNKTVNKSPDHDEQSNNNKMSYSEDTTSAMIIETKEQGIHRILCAYCSVKTIEQVNPTQDSVPKQVFQEHKVKGEGKITTYLFNCSVCQRTMIKKRNPGKFLGIHKW